MKSNSILGYSWINSFSTLERSKCSKCCLPWFSMWVWNSESYLQVYADDEILFFQVFASDFRDRRRSLSVGLNFKPFKVLEKNFSEVRDRVTIWSIPDLAMTFLIFQSSAMCCPMLSIWDLGKMKVDQSKPVTSIIPSSSSELEELEEDELEEELSENFDFFLLFFFFFFFFFFFLS